MYLSDILNIKLARKRLFLNQIKLSLFEMHVRTITENILTLFSPALCTSSNRTDVWFLYVYFKRQTIWTNKRNAKKKLYLYLHSQM